MRRFGYSRDKRSDCVQVVIALIVTPDGFPIAYEVLPGNTTQSEDRVANVLRRPTCATRRSFLGFSRRIFSTVSLRNTNRFLEYMSICDSTLPYKSAS